VGAFLFRVDLDPGAFHQAPEGVAREAAVGGEAGNIEVNRAVGLVGVAVGQDALDQADHVGHVFGRAGIDHRGSQSQGLDVLEECLREGLDDLPGGHALLAGALADLVLTLVGVGGHVPDVGDVHDVADLEAPQFQVAAQDVHKDERAEVPDVGEVVDRRAATVEPHHPRLEGLELFLALGQGVIEDDGHCTLLASVAGRVSSARLLDENGRLCGDGQRSGP